MSGGYDVERRLIERQWETAWQEGSQPRTPTAFGNVVFVPAPGAAAARLTILNGEAMQKSIGSPGANWHRHVGVIQVELRSPAQEGEGTLRRLLDLACAVFRNKELRDVDGTLVRCWEASARTLPVDGAWARGLVRWEFWRDELF